MKNLTKLLKVPGVDGVFIGPHDLSISLGVPETWESKKWLNAIKWIIQTTRKHGKSIAVHYGFDHAKEYQTRWVKQGANIVAHSCDFKIY